ncbi:melanocyte-stimulating hormone receptor-like [Actinia tenebrosa]|uniref:Melanocyte-stimulating hormone receptor-like n=1 Tax=Actinia tenebrosa TaxID=6105 RepID=A0A6P8IYM3_ACTTE|nr:melanocyte-stimulating hormone receptor-like [Actinia tenebrosa]
MNRTQNLSQTFIPFQCSLIDVYFLEVTESFSYNTFINSIIFFNAFTAFIASCSNGVLIYTIWKTESLRTPSNLLILGLTISDFGVAVSALPSYCVLRFSEIKGNLSMFCVSGTIYNVSIWTLAAASLLSLTSITADRFLAVYFHLRYQELVTTKRCKVAIFGIWISSVIICVCRVLAMGVELVICGTILLTFIILVNVFFIFKISQVISRHSLQIHAQQQSVQQSIDMPRYKKSVNTMYYVIGAFLVCYLPFVGTMVIHTIFAQNQSKELYCFILITATLVKFNSVLNPFIYCWRIREIRSAACKTLRSLWKP